MARGSRISLIDDIVGEYQIMENTLNYSRVKAKFDYVNFDKDNKDAYFKYFKPTQDFSFSKEFYDKYDLSHLIKGYQKGTFREIELDINKLKNEKDLKEYQFLTITKDGVLLFNKILVPKQKSRICWMHSIMNSFFLPDRLRLMVGNLLIRYVNDVMHTNSYGVSFAPSFFDGQLYEIYKRDKNEKLAFEFHQFILYKYVFVYLYYYYEINRKIGINPNKPVTEDNHHLLGDKFNNKEVLSIVAHSISNNVSCQLQPYETANICGHAITDAFEGVFNIFQTTFRLSFLKEGFKQFFITRTYKNTTTLERNIYENEKEFQLESCIIQIDFECGSHSVTGFKKGDSYYVVDSNRNTSIYHYDWYVEKDLIEVCEIIAVNYKENRKVEKIFIPLAMYVNKDIVSLLDVKTEMDVKKQIANAKTSSDKLREDFERLHGGKTEKQSVIYQHKKYMVHIDKTTKTKYIRAKGQRILLSDIRRRYRYV